ncbi:MAG: AAA family ATPase [Gemmatimonadales bacterium]
MPWQKARDKLLLVPNPILLLSGPIGAGKTTVARELIRLWPRPLAYIEGDTFWSFFAKGGASGPTPAGFRTIMTAMTAAAVPFAMSGTDVIVDFSIPPAFLRTARRVAAVRQVPLDYVLLRPSEDVCAARAAARTEGPIADYSGYRQFYRDFDGMDAHCVANDTMTPAEAAERILQDLEDGWFRLG